jgi:hypothetical protein
MTLHPISTVFSFRTSAMLYRVTWGPIDSTDYYSIIIETRQCDSNLKSDDIIVFHALRNPTGWTVVNNKITSTKVPTAKTSRKLLINEINK